MSKYQYFEGLKFTRDDSRGYYLNSTNRKYIHRAVWESFNGEIPKGHHIHHIDGDKSNNDIYNLQLLSASEHTSMHAKEMVKNKYDAMIKNLNEKARPKASEWHASKAGREWHKEQYKEGLAKFNEKRVEIECLCCKVKFKSIDSGVPKFCSNKCKSKHRRESGVDDILRKCIKCSTDFKVNKYSKQLNCSLECGRIGKVYKKKVR